MIWGELKLKKEKEIKSNQVKCEKYELWTNT